MEMGPLIVLLLALVVMALVAIAALLVLDRVTARMGLQVSEMASRLQHPDLVSHRAALDYRAAEFPEGPQPSESEMHLAGRVFDGDEPSEEEQVAPSPDVRVR